VQAATVIITVVTGLSAYGVRQETLAGAGRCETSIRVGQRDGTIYAIPALIPVERTSSDAA
jgi:hypothetical protein